MAAMLIPEITAFEERAAIVHYDGRLSRAKAEDRATQAQGFRDADHYWQVLVDYVISKKLK